MPGYKAYPIGKVTLPVTFGSPSNFRTEKIQFELVNFKRPYHCVLGRQAFAKFMATPHYTYNTMKLSGPSGIITVRGNPELASNARLLALAWPTRSLQNSPMRRLSSSLTQTTAPF